MPHIFQVLPPCLVGPSDPALVGAHTLVTPAAKCRSSVGVGEHVWVLREVCIAHRV
jgi:hypothetical protein